MAAESDKPVVLICTSGTAVLNYGPAVAEAFFKRIPLVVLTADRPPEWIGQQDGQTIYQDNVFGKHVKFSANLPTERDQPSVRKQVQQTISEALSVAQIAQPGPVHINIPFREPFYPSPDDKLIYENPTPASIHEENHELSDSEWGEILEKWNNNNRKLIVAGQGKTDNLLISILCTVTEEHSVPLVADILTNLHGCPKAVKNPDVFLLPWVKDNDPSLPPNLLITIGDSTISKNLKLFLRSCEIEEHWHIQTGDFPPDPFQSITKHLPILPSAFLSELVKRAASPSSEQKDYFELWQDREKAASDLVQEFTKNCEWGEFKATAEVLANLPDCKLHLANSMPVRLANFVGMQNSRTEIYSNRGTSGIDGCTSTAVGASFVTEKLVVLLTGDMAFFYDRNAFWHNYRIENLRIVLLNNHAGGIFGVIDGPSDHPELEEYFETKQALTAKHLCEEFDLEYYFCPDAESLATSLAGFFESGSGPKVLEIETNNNSNKRVFQEFKKRISKLA